MTGVVQAVGRARFATTFFTRPADTNAYTIGDVICNSTSAPVIMEIPRAVPGDGASSMLLTATLMSSANQATKLDGRLWLFDTTVVMDNDNAAFTPTDAEMRTVLAVIEFPTAAWVAGDATSGAGGNALCNAQQLWIPIRAVGTGNSIFAILEARNAYTPVSAERFDLRLGLAD
jgi:hypothetical protein